MEFQVTDKAQPAGSKRSITEQGYMLIRDCALSRAGVTEYAAGNFQPRMYNDRDPNDVIRVYRSEATLAASAPAWVGAPLANEHPAEFFNASNTPKFQTGSVVSAPVMVGPILQADILVTDARTIADIEAGKEELSNGYYSGYDFTPGTSPAGEQYDCEQLALRPNHVAVVAAGRCGSICRVSDSVDTPPMKEPKMGTVTVNGVTYEATEQLAQVIAGLQAQLSDLLAQVANSGVEAQVAVQAAQAEAEAAVAQVTGLAAQLEVATNPETIDAAVEERTEVLDHARKLIPNFDSKGKSNAAIRQEVVKAKCPDVAIKNLDSADYVRARFEGLAAGAPTTQRDTLNTALRNSVKNTDSAEDDFPNVDKARDAAIARRQQAYLKPSQRKA